MRFNHWFPAAILGLLLSVPAGAQAPPSSEAAQALAPTGKLRVAFIAAAVFAARHPATGELRGVAVDLGTELARRGGWSFEPVVYPNNPAMLAAGQAGQWDVALTGLLPDHAAVMDFSAPYMEVEHGFLVPAGSAIATAADVDRPGIRVAVLERTGTDRHLSQTLKQSSLLRTKSVAELTAMAKSGAADVVSIGKPGLFAMADQQPGARVLEGRIMVEPLAMGVPKGRHPAAAAFVSSFVESARAQGLVKAAIERAGLRGVAVPGLN